MSTLENFAGAVTADTALGGPAHEAVVLHVADTLAAWIAGSRTNDGRALIRFAGGSSGLYRGEGVLDRVMLNCALTRLSEIDDIHLASTTTPGAVIVPTALTVASALGGVDEHLVKQAIAAGYEAMVRLGLALNGPAILYRGIWPTYFAAAFGAAAVSARLLSLSQSQCAHALAMALNMAAPGVGHPSGPRMARWLLFGQAARNGVMAAYAARAGFTSDLQLLDKEFFSSVYNIAPKAAALTERLCQERSITEVSFKPWCGARQTMAASQAVRELAQEGLTAQNAQFIRVFVPPPYLKMINHGVVQGDRSSHLTSGPYQVALAVVSPEARFGVEHAPDSLDPALSAIMDKVSIEADDALLAHFPRAWPARVEVRNASTTQCRLMVHIPGDPERPFGKNEVLDKFMRVVAPLLGEESAREWAGRALGATATTGEVLKDLERGYAA